MVNQYQMPYQSSSAASYVGLAQFGLRIIRGYAAVRRAARQLSAWQRRRLLLGLWVYVSGSDRHSTA